MCTTTKKLMADIIDNRDVRSAKGLDSCKIVLINKADLLDYTTDPSNPMIVTDLAMAISTKGFSFPNVKQVNDSGSEFVPKEDDYDAHKHTLNLALRKPTAENLLQLANLERNIEGVVAVVKMKFKGTNNLDAFVIYGLDAGLKVTASTTNSKEYAKLTLATKDDELEVYGPRVLRLGTYTETNNVFSNDIPA